MESSVTCHVFIGSATHQTENTGSYFVIFQKRKRFVKSHIVSRGLFIIQNWIELVQGDSSGQCSSIKQRNKQILGSTVYRVVICWVIH
jgi:hypothetical protein